MHNANFFPQHSSVKAVSRITTEIAQVLITLPPDLAAQRMDEFASKFRSLFVRSGLTDEEAELLVSTLVEQVHTAAATLNGLADAGVTVH